MNELEQLLATAGFEPRRPQIALFEHLISATRRGVVAQAGTGTGKSLAILAAAANRARATGRQSIVITPTLTLMNQYRDGDMPIAARAFDDLEFGELRGRAHYWCEMTKSGNGVMGAEYFGGCLGRDAGCSMKGQGGCDESCDESCDAIHEKRWNCEYQDAKRAAMSANVVVTNADMLIVNDRILAPLEANFFDLDGSLFVDEAHTLDQKLRDYASRSLHWSSLERFKFAGGAGKAVARWLKNDDGGVTLRKPTDVPFSDLKAIAEAAMPEERPKDGLTKQRETQEAAARIMAFLQDPHDSAVLHVNQGSLKMDWINVAKSSGELLTARSFGLVSATVPRTMSAALGVGDAPFIDVGHPFDYSKSWIGFSAYGGDYKSAQHDSNFEQRVNEVLDMIRRSKGGTLVLFSSFRDLERVSERITPILKSELGVPILTQERDMDPRDRQALADEFKAHGDAVLLGSSSFGTGFDCPGWGLRCVIMWKLPYPAVDPVTRAIMSSSYSRYSDTMKTVAVQAIGRLVRTEEDKGVVWIADNRGRTLLDSRDPLTAHLTEFSRL